MITNNGLLSCQQVMPQFEVSVTVINYAPRVINYAPREHL